MSEYVRRRAADQFGFVTCPLCGKRLHWKEAQNMHYVSRAHMNTRFDLRNCLAGDYSCNIARNGNYPRYTQYLLATHGLEWLQTLIHDGDTVRKWSPEELKGEIARFKQLLLTV